MIGQLGLLSTNAKMLPKIVPMSQGRKKPHPG